MSSAADTPSGSGRGDLLFRALLGSLLFLYLGFILATLLSNVWWLGKPGPGGLRPIAALADQPLLGQEVRAALVLSLQTSVVTVLLALLVAIPSAYALSRFRLRGEAIIDMVIDLPIVVPPLLAGLSLLLFFRQTPLGHWLERIFGDIVYTRRAIVVAQFYIAAAFAIRAIKASFDSINPRFEAVARSLGCGPWQALWKVALPLARNGIFAGAVMTWARAMGEFAPVLILAAGTPWRPDRPGHTEVLSVAAFLNNSAGHLEIAIAVTVLMIAIAACTLVLFKKLGGKGYLW
ncbi:MAG: ABC transporter permease subunit [Armatimonadetes bacterium]|nr:ABC transporter permease subunit [Armatimonadota bacterium]